MHSRLWVLKPVNFGLGLALLFVACRTIVRFLPARMYGSDFSQAYLAAHAWQHGRDPYQLRLDDYAREQGLKFTEMLPQATNPPLLIWMFRPLACLPVARAFWIYVGIETLSLLVALA